MLEKSCIGYLLVAQLAYHLVGDGDSQILQFSDSVILKFCNFGVASLCYNSTSQKQRNIAQIIIMPKILHFFSGERPLHY